MAHKEKRKVSDSMSNDEHRRFPLRQNSDKGRILFERFVDLCIPLVKAENQTSVRTLLWKRYDNAKPHYTKSPEFHHTINSKYKDIRTTKKSVYVHIYEICNLLKAYKRKPEKKTSDSDNGRESADGGIGALCGKGSKDKKGSETCQGLLNSTANSGALQGASSKREPATISVIDNTVTAYNDTASGLHDGVFKSAGETHDGKFKTREKNKETNRQTSSDSDAGIATSSGSDLEIISIGTRPLQETSCALLGRTDYLVHKMLKGDSVDSGNAGKSGCLTEKVKTDTSGDLSKMDTVDNDENRDSDFLESKAGLSHDAVFREVTDTAVEIDTASDSTEKDTADNDEKNRKSNVQDSEVALNDDTDGADKKGMNAGCKLESVVTSPSLVTPDVRGVQDAKPAMGIPQYGDNAAGSIACLYDGDVEMKGDDDANMPEVPETGGLLEPSSLDASCELVMECDSVEWPEDKSDCVDVNAIVPGTVSTTQTGDGDKPSLCGNVQSSCQSTTDEPSSTTVVTHGFQNANETDQSLCRPSTSASSDRLRETKKLPEQAPEKIESGCRAESSVTSVGAVMDVEQDRKRKRDSDPLKDNKPSSSVQDADLDVGPDTKKKKTASTSQIRRLENLLKEVSDEIRRLQEKELTLDELDEEDSDHIQEHRLKKRFMKIWNKLCELKGLSSGTGRAIEKRICFEGTRYQEINKKIEKFVNKHGFPDYHDVLGIVRKVNRKKQMNLKPKYLNEIAADAFRTVGISLQQRREVDFRLNFGSHLTDDFKATNDPAKRDQDLFKRLKSNQSIGKKRLEGVLNEYKEKQYALEQSGHLVDDGSDTENAHKEEEEEEDHADDHDDPLLNLQSVSDTEGDMTSQVESREDNDGDESDQSVAEVQWSPLPSIEEGADNSDTADVVPSSIKNIDASGDGESTVTRMQASNSSLGLNPGNLPIQSLEKLVCKSKAEVVLRKLDWEMLAKSAKVSAAASVPGGLSVKKAGDSSGGISVKDEPSFDPDYNIDSPQEPMSTISPCITPPQDVTSSCSPSKLPVGGAASVSFPQGAYRNVPVIRVPQSQDMECIVISDSDE
ncbi:uncharacterized protein [Ptychodera flava]|uniref:uncharacterized protein n=1 Tax=Ptychodera flava TaxID=63121 RepID=UPI00396A006D